MVLTKVRIKIFKGSPQCQLCLVPIPGEPNSFEDMGTAMTAVTDKLPLGHYLLLPVMTKYEGKEDEVQV